MIATRTTFFFGLIFLVIAIPSWAQEARDHTSCRITMEQCDSIMLAQGYNIAETNPASESRNNTVIRPRPIEVLLIYDTRIQDMTGLNNQEITEIILESAQDVPDGIDNAQGDNPGFNFTVSDFTAPYVENTPFTTLYTYLLLVNDGKMDEITIQRDIIDYDAIVYIAAPGTPGSGNGVASLMSINPGPFAMFKSVGVVKWSALAAGTVVVGHEIGHLFGMDHELGQTSTSSESYARAYVSQNHATIMKAAPSALQDTAVYSGPNSIIDGDTLGSVDECNICVFDTIKFLYWIDNPRTYIDSIWGYTCGTGSLDVESNADSLHWTVLEGDAGLSDNIGNNITYNCASPSIVQLRATRSGRAYSIWDTIYLYPDHSVEIDYTLGSGEVYTLPDGSMVNQAGTYTVVLTNQYGCDSTIVTHLELSTSADDPSLIEISIHPNPTTGKVTVSNFDDIQEVRVYSITGKLMLSRYKESTINISDLIGGIYLIQVITDDGFYWGRVSKL